MSEVRAVVASADGCVDFVHGDVDVSFVYEDGDDVECHLAVYTPCVGVGFFHLELGEESIVVADGFKALL